MPWVCVVVSKHVFNNGVDKIRKEVQCVIKRDFLDFLVFDDGFNGERYGFLSCKSVSKNLASLHRSGIIMAALPSLDNPRLLKESEVAAMFVLPNSTDIFTRGNMVKVVGDHVFSGLFGIVIGEQGGMSDVLFSFHLSKTIKTIDNKNLSMVKESL